MVWAIIIIFIALFFLGLLFSFWKLILLTTIGAVIGGPIGGVIGFILGLMVSPRKSFKATSSNRSRPENNTSVTIEWLTPVVHLVSYYAKYQGQPWTSQKVNFVKSMFASHCHTEEDLMYLRDVLKQKDHAVQLQIHLILQQQLDEESKLEIFKLCAQAIHLNIFDDHVTEHALTDLAKRLLLHAKDYQPIIRLFKTHYKHSFNEDIYSNQGNSKDLAIAYQRLNIHDESTKEEVIKAYRVKMMKYHPDKHPTATDEEKEKLTEKSIELQQAKDLIIRHLERI